MADGATVLDDLPVELKGRILEQVGLSELDVARRAASSYREAAASALASAAWRGAAANAESLQLRLLAAGAFRSEQLSGSHGGVRGLAICANTLASGTKDGFARLWDVSDPARPALSRELTHPDWVGAVALSADGEALATGCDDGAVRLFATSPHAGADAATTLRGDSTAWIVGVAFDERDGAAAPDRRVLSCARDSELLLRRCEDGAVVSRAYTRPSRAPGDRHFTQFTSFDAARGVVACGVASSASSATESHVGIQLFRVGEAALEQTGSLRGHNGACSATALDRGLDGAARTLASGGSNGSVQLWDTRAAQCQQHLANGCSGSVGALALSGDLLIAARGDSPKLSVWDLRKGAKGLVQTLRGYANNDSLCYDVERARLVVGDRMGAMRLWSMPGAGRAHVYVQ
jgi:WD40 repeat protein